MGSLKIGRLVLRSLAGRPATLMYPDVPREWKERTRGRIEIEIEGCIFCYACARRCPAGALTVDRMAMNWAIDRMGCVQCNHCVDVCPKHCLRCEPEYTPPDTKKVVDVFVMHEAETP